MSKVIVYHRFYGCDTGCCGHVIEVGNESKYDFFHPSYGQDYREFAEELVREHFGEEHVKDLDWENCNIVYD